MREIKFRAWDNINKTMDYNMGYGGNISRDMNQAPGIGDGEDFSYLMQYTGLKDRNRKKIYEGDIIKIYCGSRDDIFQVGTIEYDAKYQGFYASGCIVERYFMYEVEIIGNIYENPELIKTHST